MARPTLPVLNDPTPGWTTVMRDAIFDVSDRVDAALTATVSTTGVPGVVQVESFSPGGTDTQKMQAALAYAAAQPRVPWLQLPARVFNTGSATFQLFTGAKIMGAGGPGLGSLNEEIASGKAVPGKWVTSCGSGAAAMLQATGTVYNTHFAGIVFQGGVNSQIFRSTVNSYTCVFHNLTFYGCKHAFGSPAEKWLGTQFIFSGHWTFLGIQDVQCTLGGSDASLWMYGYANINSGPVVGAGRPIVHLSSLGKTNVGWTYFTAEADWIGIQVSGSTTCQISFFGGAFEGRSQTNLATRPVINLQGGSNFFYGPYLGQVSGSSSTVSGVVHQSGGIAYWYGGSYLKGSGVNDTFPILYQTAGVSRFYGPPVSETGGQIRIRWSDGTVQTCAAPANGVVA